MASVEYYVDPVTKQIKTRPKKKKKEDAPTKKLPLPADTKTDTTVGGAVKAIKKRKSFIDDIMKNW